MFDEKLLRRPDFLEGVALRLADGGFWTVPMPFGSDSEDQRELATTRLLAVNSPRYIELLKALRDAEDHSEVLRIELALAICLLRHNYNLNPSILGTLLSFHDRESLARMQRAMSEVASAHLRAFRPAPERLRGTSESHLLRPPAVRAYST